MVMSSPLSLMDLDELMASRWRLRMSVSVLLALLPIAFASQSAFGIHMLAICPALVLRHEVWGKEINMYGQADIHAGFVPSLQRWCKFGPQRLQLLA